MSNSEGEAMLVDLPDEEQQEQEQAEDSGNQEIVDRKSGDIGAGAPESPTSTTNCRSSLQLPTEVQQEVANAFQNSMAGITSFFETLHTSFIPAVKEDVLRDLDFLGELREELTLIKGRAEARLLRLNGVALTCQSACNQVFGGSQGRASGLDVQAENCQEEIQMIQENNGNEDQDQAPGVGGAPNTGQGQAKDKDPKPAEQ